MTRLRNLDWDAVAGIIAAVVALVLHLIHVADTGVLLSITLVVLALILLRDLRREGRDERIGALVEQIDSALHRLQANLSPPDARLIGPRQLRTESVRFAQRAQGDMIWFNVCLLMFVPQPLFDVLLRPAIENPRITSIQFFLDEGERERWEKAVLPKVAACRGNEKVCMPKWCSLHESVSFILTETEPDGATEAHLSFWGEPFMSRVTGHDVPRYIFHVQGHSELISRLLDLQRLYSVSQ